MNIEILFTISLIFGILGIVFYRYNDRLSTQHDLVPWGMFFCIFGWAAVIVFGTALIFGE